MSADLMEEEIDLAEYWNILKKWKVKIVLFVFVGTLASIVISLMMTKAYKSEATLMVIGGSKSGGAASLAQVALGGVLSGLGGGSSNASQVMAILKSRTLAEKMIEKYSLEVVFFKEKDPTRAPEDIVDTLRGIVNFTEEKKTNLINITAVYKNPQWSADLVNNYIKEAMVFINQNSFTSAKRNRIFIETQLEKAKVNLLEAGKDLTDFYETNNISNVRPMVDVNVSLHKDESAEFEKLQKQVSEVTEKINGVRVVKNVPQQVYLQYLTLRRELLGQVHALLTQQYEMAKIEEQKEEPSFQVIDWARVPVHKFKPKRAQIVVTSFFICIGLITFYAFLHEYFEKTKLNKTA